MKARRLEVRLILAIVTILVLFFLIHRILSHWPQKKQPVKVTTGLASGMVASAHPIASKVGVEILRKGGNAIDAAVATAFALGVAEPFASGIGGGGFMLIYIAKSKRVVTIDYRETAPSRATPEIFQTPDVQQGVDQVGHSSVAVPGSVAGLALALRQYGTMDLKSVMEPAIEVAENGYEVGKLLNIMMANNSQKLSKFPAAAQIYLKHGLPYKVGERLYLKDLARTYRLIAENGPDVFYQGAIAEAIEDEMKSSRTGLMTREDLAAYRPVERPPVQGNYRGYQIFSMGPPSSGGTHVIELLNIFEGYDIPRLGLNTPDSISLMAEAMTKVFSDREKFMGDPDFVRIPLNNLLSKEYAEKLRMEIGQRKASVQVVLKDRSADRSHQTSHLSVVDTEGNLVALTQTINSFFGSGVVVPGTGIMLNNEMNDFVLREGSLNSVAPRKRPLSSMSPTLVLKDGRPFLTIGMPGATRIITVLPQILMNMIDRRMSIQEAIDAPRFHCMADKEIFVESRIPQKVRDVLTSKGYTVVVKESFDLYFGGAQGVMIDPKTQTLQGGADPRREGSVLGYRPVGGVGPGKKTPALTLMAVIVIVMAVILVLLVALAALFFSRRRQTERLISQFGAAEYARAVRESGDRRRAEAVLKRRKERVEAFHLRPLGSGDRDRFIESWHKIQARFVDDPADAVAEVERLIGNVMSKRGYPVTDFEQRAADISVDHPRVVGNYRSAHGIMVRQTQGQIMTEELRQAMLHYRKVFVELLGELEESGANTAIALGHTRSAKDR